MEIIAKLIERVEQVEQVHHVYDTFGFDSNIGVITVTLEDCSIPNQIFRYAVYANRGVATESKLFRTRFFANIYFKEMRTKYQKGVTR